MKYKIQNKNKHGFNGLMFCGQNISVSISAIRVPIKSVLVFALCFLSLASCKKDLDMTVLQKTVLEDSDFTCIKAERSWQIEIVQDEKCFVELEYSAYLEPHLKCEVTENQIPLIGNVLEIGFTASGNLASGSVNKAKVHVVDLESLELTGACNADINGSFSKRFLAVLDKSSVCVGGNFLSSVNVELKGASSMKDLTGEGSFAIVMEDDSHFVGRLKFSQPESDFAVMAKKNSSFVNQENSEVAIAEIFSSENSLVNISQTIINETVNVNLEENSEAMVHVRDGACVKGALNGCSTLYHYGNVIFASDFVCDTTSFVVRL